MARPGDDSGNADSSENRPSTPDSATSAGFNTDQLPPNTSRTSENYSDDDDDDDDDQAAVDPLVIPDEPDEGDPEDEEGEDLYNDNFMEYLLSPLLLPSPSPSPCPSP